MMSEPHSDSPRTLNMALITSAITNFTQEIMLNIFCKHKVV